MSMYDWIWTQLKSLLNAVAPEFIKGATKELASSLSNFIQKFKREADKEYKFTSYHKHVTVYSDGHGIVQISPTLKVQKDSFSRIQHFLGLGDCGLKGSKLESLPSLTRRFEKDKKSRFFGQTLCCKLISINGKDIPHGKRRLKIVPDKEEDSDTRRPFFIEFGERRFKAGDMIRYKWGYSYPNLYPTKRSEMSKFNLGEDAEEKCCKATLHLKHDIDKLTFILSFEDGITLEDRLPELWESDQQTKKGNPCGVLEKEEDSYYTKYSKTIKNGKHGHDYIMKWYLK